MKTRKTEIIKDAGLYAGSTYTATFLDVLNGIILRNVIAPASMGVWSLLQVILGYSKYATLGTGPAMVREIPFRRGRGEKEKAEQIKNNVFSWSLVTSSVLAVGIIAYTVVMRHSLSREMMWGLAAVAFLTVLQRCYNLYIVILRAYKTFRLASLSNVLSSLITLLLTVTIVWKFKFYGLLFATILGYVLILTLIHKNSNLRFKIEFDKKILKDMSFLGISLVAVQGCMTVLRSIDRLVIAKWLNFEALGYYSVAIMFQTYLTILPNVADMVLNPHLFEKAGEDLTSERLKRNVIEPIIAMACVMPCCILIAWVLVPPMVRFLMPEYRSGIPAARILLFSSFFIGTARPLMAYLIMIKKHLWLIPIILFASIVSGFLSWYWLVIAHGGIEAVALASVISFGIYFVVSFVVCASSLVSSKALPVIMVTVLGPLFYAVGAVKFLNFLFFQMGDSIVTWLTVLTVSLLLCIPLIFILEKETGVVSRIKTILWEKFLPHLS